MRDDIQVVHGYKIIDEVHIGDKIIIFGENSNLKPEERYLCSYCEKNDLFTYYEEGFAGSYVEIMKLFNERVHNQIEKVEKERQQITVPLEVITTDQCYTDDLSQSICDKVVAIKETSLRPEYRTADKQLVLVTGGFGAEGNSRGNAVFCTNLYSGKDTRWERYDVQGEVKPEHLPDWAKNRAAKIRENTLLKDKQAELVEKER